MPDPCQNIPKSISIVELSNRDIDILLAALRHYQEHGCPLMTHLETRASLEEVDTLCERINTQNLLED